MTCIMGDEPAEAEEDGGKARSGWLVGERPMAERDSGSRRSSAKGLAGGAGGEAGQAGRSRKRAVVGQWKPAEGDRKYLICIFALLCSCRVFAATVLLLFCYYLLSTRYRCDLQLLSAYRSVYLLAESAHVPPTRSGQPGLAPKAA